MTHPKKLISLTEACKIARGDYDGPPTIPIQFDGDVPRLTYDQRDVLLNMKDGKWYHPRDLGKYACERFYLRDRGLIEQRTVMMLVSNYRITQAGREAIGRLANPDPKEGL